MTRRIREVNGVQTRPKDCDCESCLEAWGEWMDGIFEADRLASRDPERAGGAKPATGDEWQRYLDAEFPLVRSNP